MYGISESLTVSYCSVVACRPPCRSWTPGSSFFLTNTRRPGDNSVSVYKDSHSIFSVAMVTMEPSRRTWTEKPVACAIVAMAACPLSPTSSGQAVLVASMLPNPSWASVTWKRGWPLLTLILRKVKKFLYVRSSDVVDGDGDDCRCCLFWMLIDVDLTFRKTSTLNLTFRKTSTFTLTFRKTSTELTFWFDLSQNVKKSWRFDLTFRKTSSHTLTFCKRSNKLTFCN